MKRFIYLFITIFFPGILFSQDRYQTYFIDSVEVETFTYATKDGEKLELDVYQPFDDWEENRAVIIYVHGGGFSGGSRNDENNINFCKRLAELGYVSVSMSYRLTRKDKPEGFGCNCTASDKLNTFNAAMEDIQEASYFLIENRDMLRIDPQKIILAGSSAGAEAILYSGYQPPMCYDLPSGPVSYAGLISMAGAIPDTSYIYNESAVPTMFFHGTCDNLVPFAAAPHHYCNENQEGYLVLHGSYTIAQKLRELNVPYWLHTSCGSGHEIAGKPMTEYFDEITEFCYQYIIREEGEFRETVMPGEQANCDYKQFNFYK
ncbi:MAG: alpha/beta hydrolase [Mariniphaga sp.]|nr:alpha/beta hydrolase [Mariniphaga sp.]